MPERNTIFVIEYTSIYGGKVRQEFVSQATAETWCRQIGRKDLIERIVEEDRKDTDA
jgi:hypothetical protein